MVDGLPYIDGSIVERLDKGKGDFDRYRTAIIGEPRGSPVAVGAYLLDSDVADYGVIFFNNAGYLEMCGHGTIGVVTTLAHLGRLEPGLVSFETPAGVVRAELLKDGRVSFENVPSYRYAKAVEIELGASGKITGDVAYGGNWFFISSDHGQTLRASKIDTLVMFASLVMDVLSHRRATGADGAAIDHVELVCPSEVANARNFVLCPGGEYDRSPCGTGTSAKLACLFQDGKLAEGEVYRVESIIGSIFEGMIRKEDDKLIPTITGRAFVNGDATILIDSEDPFAWGIAF